MPLLVPISVGELLDKLTILDIKAEAIGDPAKRANVLKERDALAAVRQREIAHSAEVEVLYAELKQVNKALWDVEDRLRERERDHAFDAGFVELARSVYRHNDRRAVLKRRINQLTGSELIEGKSYV